MDIGKLTTVNQCLPTKRPCKIGDDWRKLLFQYADIVAEKMNVKPIEAKKNITGYCTWYYYYKDVTQQHMLENIEA